MAATVQTQPNGDQLLALDYIPDPIAQRFLEDPTFCTGFFGPIGCGKTTAGVMKVWMYAQAYPGARIAVIRDTYPNLTDTTMASFFAWLPEGPAGVYHRSTRTFMLNTSGAPATILFRAMDDKDDIKNVLSLDLAAAFIDEPQGGLNLDTSALSAEPGLDYELIKMLQSRLGRQTGYKPMWWMTGNPPSPSHWIAHLFRYYGKGEPLNDNPKAHLYLGSAAANVKNLTEGYYDNLVEIFGRDTPLARRFLRGEWIEMAAINPFHSEWITEYKELPKEGLVTHIGIDPAISKNDKAARTAITVVSQSQREVETKGQLYVREAVTGHWSLYEQIDKLIKLARQYDASTIAIEKVAYQAALGEVLQYELRVAGLHPHVELIPPEGDKLRRANKWSPLVESGVVQFNRATQSELISGMLSVPQNKNAWDIVDATGLCIDSFPRIPAASSSLLPRQTLAESYGQDLENRIVGGKRPNAALRRKQHAMFSVSGTKKNPYSYVGVRR